MMNVRCEDFENEFAAFKSGELDPQKNEAFAAHQKQCAHCATYAAGLYEVRQTLQALPQLEAPPYFASNLEREINRQKYGEKPGQSASGVPRLLALASGFAIALIVSFVVLQPGNQPGTLSPNSGTMAEEQTLDGKGLPETTLPVLNENTALAPMLAHEGPVDTAIHRLPERAGQDSIPIPDDYWQLDQVSTTPGDN